MTRSAASVAVALLLLVPGLLAQTTVVLQATADNTIYESATGSLSNGAGSGLFAGVSGMGVEQRAMLRFEVTESLPAGAVVTAAELTLNVTLTQPGTSLISSHRLLASFGEGASVASGGGGGGGAAAPGDATWLHRSYPSVLWSTPGADFDAFASDAVVVDGIGSYTWSGPAMVADVQSWLNDPSQEFGWLLMQIPIGPAPSKRFASRENLSASLRPTLAITFQLPMAFPGSGEDLLLESGVESEPDLADVELASGGDALTLRLFSPLGTYLGAAPVLIGQIFSTGAPPLSPPGFPEVHVDPGAALAPFVILDGNDTPLGPLGIPFQGFELEFPTLPPVAGGTSVMIQGLVLDGAAANGFFAITPGHELRFL